MDPEYLYVLITDSQYKDLQAFDSLQGLFSSDMITFDGGQYHYCLASKFDIEQYDGDNYEALEALALTFRYGVFTDSGRYSWSW